MSHTFYIALSYGIAALIVALLILWVWLDGRGRRRDLEELERVGVRRRSSVASVDEAR
ncbi:heme exporter protein CcmD [Pseudorhizobium marinum]|uniref:heme exporter protein CcmD n=1 Tax=Pseudorhizobium marinum TaxID=1496690 RepID=UPI00097CB27B|nr:heme exporter protein CcmD [Pseudorhizobium marinum]